MAYYKNHLIDPTFFFSAIEEFAFDYDWYACKGKKLDDLHKLVYDFDKRTIRGSLQTQGLSLDMSKTGNINTNEYNFYCKSLYRISIGDFIFYKNTWLHVDSVHEYDEWGVRECHLKMVQLSAYKDLEEYVRYLNGEEII